jgi:hypothetical protein
LGANTTKTDVVVPVVGIVVVAPGATQIVVVVVPRAAAKRTALSLLLSVKKIFEYRVSDIQMIRVTKKL